MSGTPARPKQRILFSLEEFHRRVRRVRQAVSERRLDGLVISRPDNIFYLTGYQTLGNFAYQVLVVPVESDPCLVVRYGERSNVWARSWLQNAAFYRDTEDPVAVTKEILGQAKLLRVGIEMSSMFLTVASFQALVSSVSTSTFQDCSGIIERQRAVKSAEEIAYVKRAAAVSSAAVQAGLDAVGDGRTDRDVAAAVYAAMIRAGGEYPPLPPFVTVGLETTLFHNTWSGEPIQKGDLVFIEVPGVVGRYLAPLARSASLGEPPAHLVERHKVAMESLETGIAAMAPGVTCAEVYEAFAAPYARAGHEIAIKAGYSVGISFPPRWSEHDELSLLPGNRTVLEPGMVLHTPRTVRVYGDQTSIVSETTLITETGHEVLTRAQREIARR